MLEKVSVLAGFLAIGLLASHVALADAPPSFDFKYFESLPEDQKQDAAKQYLLQKHPIGSDAASLIAEIKKAGTVCVDPPKSYAYCIYWIGDLPRTEWSFGVGIKDANITSVEVDRVVKTNLIQH